MLIQCNYLALRAKAATADDCVKGQWGTQVILSMWKIGDILMEEMLLMCVVFRCCLVKCC